MHRRARTVDAPHAEDFHRAHVGAGGDALLQQRAEGLGEQQCDGGGGHREGQGVPSVAVTPVAPDTTRFVPQPG
jgi:hypothetical protein